VSGDYMIFGIPDGALVVGCIHKLEDVKELVVSVSLEPMP
jgi:hypothetical protein